MTRASCPSCHQVFSPLMAEERKQSLEFPTCRQEQYMGVFLENRQVLPLLRYVWSVSRQPGQLLNFLSLAFCESLIDCSVTENIAKTKILELAHVVSRLQEALIGKVCLVVLSSECAGLHLTQNGCFHCLLLLTTNTLIFSPVELFLLL